MRKVDGIGIGHNFLNHSYYLVDRCSDSSGFSLGSVIRKARSPSPGLLGRQFRSISIDNGEKHICKCHCTNAWWFPGVTPPGIHGHCYVNKKTLKITGEYTCYGLPCILEGVAIIIVMVISCFESWNKLSHEFGLVELNANKCDSMLFHSKSQHCFISKDDGRCCNVWGSLVLRPPAQE